MHVFVCECVWVYECVCSNVVNVCECAWVMREWLSEWMCYKYVRVCAIDCECVRVMRVNASVFENLWVFVSFFLIIYGFIWESVWMCIRLFVCECDCLLLFVWVFQFFLIVFSFMLYCVWLWVSDVSVIEWVIVFVSMFHCMCKWLWVYVSKCEWARLFVNVYSFFFDCLWLNWECVWMCMSVCECMCLCVRVSVYICDCL